MARDFKNKTMVAKYVFPKISRGNVGKSRRDFQLYLFAYLCLIYEDIDLFGRSGDTCDLKTMSNVFCG
jgi:hypothetical protein